MLPACPGQYPARLLPGSGSPGQSGTTSPLFGRPAATIVVCGYGPHAPAKSLVLTGVSAIRLQQSLEKASTTPVACPSVPATATRYVFLAIDASGHEVQMPVTASNDRCGIVSNGTGVRYGWSPPALINSEFGGGLPGGGGAIPSSPIEIPGPPPSGNQGTPVR